MIVVRDTRAEKRLSIISVISVSNTLLRHRIMCVSYTFPVRETSPITGRFPNMGRRIISYQDVLRSEFKNVNH